MRRMTAVLGSVVLIGACGRSPTAYGAPGAGAPGGQFTLAATAPQAQSLVGAWRGFVNMNGMNGQFDLVVQPSGAYSETLQAGQMMTMQSGEIRATGPGIITFVVEDWEPKSHNVYMPQGTVGGYYSPEASDKPPGGAWRVQFNGPNSFMMQDVNLGGTITFTRVG